ncbi:nuclear transport factor 2 family protein [Rhodococcoides fascians]|uniref:nuclear transport factor 2 family protein n=1 Tax=Rhodococcoides fascians TaxID=1828 RepID=UPI0018AFDC82|nr:nuclear transport factor 2 family protein [Rhodococcus fascians]
MREIIDKQDIHDLLMRYCRGCDRGDEALIASCYHEGGVDDHGDFVVAAEDVAPLFVKLAARSPYGSMHFIGNELIEIEGDTAFAETYFMAIKDIARGDDRFLRIRAGRYVDRLERRDGRWGIVERVLADEWNTVNEMPERLGGPEKYRFGTRDDSDPVWAIRRGRVARRHLSDVSEIGKRGV